MERIFLFIKHRLNFLWEIIEYGNDKIFSLLYKNKLEHVISEIIEEISARPYSIRKLNVFDAEALGAMISRQTISDLEYFHPHSFNTSAIRKKLGNDSFLMMGVFESDRLIGYFFLRFFANRQSFVGRLIDYNYRGKGIGLIMNKIMYETAWRMGFRCLSTISRNNTNVMNAHAKNPSVVIIGELPNEYLLIEFVRDKKETSNLGLLTNSPTRFPVL
jgi:hypothetical protein